MPLRIKLPSILTNNLKNPTSIRTMSSSPFAPSSNEKLNLTSSIKLQDGTSQPRFGIGAWDMRGNECYTALRHAFEKVGYRSVDTARYYRNEEQVGRAIRDTIQQTSIQRKDIYATTKLFTNDMGGGENSKLAYQDSLTKSGLDYWDLVLLHAPDGGKEFRLDTWKTLSEFVKNGQIRSLGVSNFGAHHIEELMSSEEGKAIKPVVNQIECHPFFAQKEVRQASEKHGIVVQAYCPLARGRYYGDKTLVDVAKRNDKSEAQIMLRWLTQHGIIPLPKSSNEKRQLENAQSLEFTLSDEDMKLLDSLDRGKRGAVESQTMSQDAP